MTQEEKGKTYALHKASEKLHDYYGSAMLNVVQFNGYDIQDAYIEGCNHINEGMIEALRTEYEKGRVDVLDKTCKWLQNYFKGVPGGSVYIEDFKKAMEE